MAGTGLPSDCFSDNNLAFYQEGLLSGRIHCVLLLGTILGGDKDKLSSWKGNGTTSRSGKEESKAVKRHLSPSLPEWKTGRPVSLKHRSKSWWGGSLCSPLPGHACEGGNLTSAFVPSSVPSPQDFIPSPTLHPTNVFFFSFCQNQRNSN